MPGYKAIGQVGLGGFLYVAAAKLISKVSQYGGTGTPVPERPARYTPAVLSALSSYPTPQTLLPMPNLAQNATATITMSRLPSTDQSTLSPLWTVFLSLWSILQVIIHFLTEQCGELIAELTVQLLFVMAIAYFGNNIDQALRIILGHPKSPTPDERVDDKAPTNSSTMQITRATIRVLHKLADKIQYRINNLEAMITNIIVEGKQAINNVRTELGHAKKTITSLEGKLRDMIEDRDRKLEEADTRLKSSIQKVQELEADLEEMSTKHDGAMEDSQTKLEEADKKLNKSENDLSEAVDKIAVLETNLQCMVDDRDKAANEGRTEAENAVKQIKKLEAQRKYWESQFKERKATTDDMIDKAVTTAKNNAERAKQRLLEIANAGTHSEISKLKTAHEKAEKELIAAKNHSASEIATLKEALAKKEEMEKDLIAAKSQSVSEVATLKAALAKKTEDEESASAFNPAAKEFTPSRGGSSDSTLTFTPYTSLPATPFPQSPSPYPTAPYQHTSLPATPLGPSLSPLPPTPHQHTPFKKQKLEGEPARNLEQVNKRMAERSRRTMMGLPAEDEETTPLSAEELDRRMAALTTIRAPSQQFNPQQPAFVPGPSQPSPFQPVQSPTLSAPELGRRTRTPEMTGQSPTPSAPELGPHPETPENAGQPPTPPTGPSNPAPPKRHNYRGLKPGAPGTPEINWPAPPPSLVEGAPTAPRAMRRNGGRPPGLEPCFIAPRPRPNRGNFNASGRGNGGSTTRERPQLPAFLRENAQKKEEGGKEGGAE